jgi:hypothetical protein
VTLLPLASLSDSSTKTLRERRLSEAEVESAIDLLEKHGYQTTESTAAGSSRIIRAVNTTSPQGNH